MGTNRSGSLERAGGLRTRWSRSVAAAGAPADPQAVAAIGESMLQRWEEPHRHYHDRRHLAAVLHALDRGCRPRTPSAAVRLAAWFHDAVYQGRPGEDERASADLARRLLAGLAVAAEVTAEVSRLVLLTRDHLVADGDTDGALLADADLAILAAPHPEYARYLRGIRAEYAHLDDATFAAGRTAVVAALLERPVLFRTGVGRDHREATARANLRAELDALVRHPCRP